MSDWWVKLFGSQIVIRGCFWGIERGFSLRILSVLCPGLSRQLFLRAIPKFCKRGPSFHNLQLQYAFRNSYQRESVEVSRQLPHPASENEHSVDIFLSILDPVEVQVEK